MLLSGSVPPEALIAHPSPELPITAADIIDVGMWSDGVERDGFKELTSEEWRWLAVKLQSSQNVKVLNLSGNTISADRMRGLTEHLGMLTSLQEINLRCTNIGDEGAGRLAEPLGKLTALLKLNLSGAACCVCFMRDLRDAVCLDCAMRCCLLCF
jgi:Ran GTPase-activating protein (RanGAP) involved in mRNA processing and transport